ncbi:peptide chain release factor 1 [Roseomonas sp. SSH11]|uniref:Peptide chain release factor 1 n=1 Tax=Pararoseomonas baculiformis TaxID=2820812 RepID=A0ABS4AK17_9PROT|nr:peptide chain release factor 1 [Pararoseomonas baculiformis]MBP0447363.1 peptide chain release factor 1 [Pararoseomonas baculiformis]
MTANEAERALAELDRLLNDPDVQMDPMRVWTLADRLSGSVPATAQPTSQTSR